MPGRRFLNRNRANLLANFAGLGWSAAIQLACVPIYIHFIGIEGYGLLGFYLTLQGAFEILDLGLSPTMNREMARHSAEPGTADMTRDLVRTFELFYWSIGVVLGLSLALTSPLIASHWLKVATLPASEVRRAVVAMGILTTLQWPLSLYNGGLMGLQRQVLMNAIKISMNTIGAAGAVAILWLVSPTIDSFFTWQIVTAAVRIALTGLLFWRCLSPSEHRAHFRPQLLAGTWKFAIGVSGITLTALVMTQLDKIILSTIFPLKEFGYYSLSLLAASGLVIVINPIFSSIYPRFAVLFVANEPEMLSSLYHRSTQLLACLLLPAAAILAFFSFDILLLWTHDYETARRAATITTILAVGTALNGMMIPTYALQLASGWTKLGVQINGLLIVMLVPSILLLTPKFGAIGGALVWLLLNALYMLLGIPLTHRRLLKGEALRWLTQDVVAPLLAAVVVVWGARQLIVSSMSPLVSVTVLLSVTLVALAAASLCTPFGRSWVGGAWRTARSSPLAVR